MACCPSTTVVTSLYPVLFSIPKATCMIKVTVWQAWLLPLAGLQSINRQHQGLCQHPAELGAQSGQLHGLKNSCITNRADGVSERC